MDEEIGGLGDWMHCKRMERRHRGKSSEVYSCNFIRQGSNLLRAVRKNV